MKNDWFCLSQGVSGDASCRVQALIMLPELCLSSSQYLNCSSLVFHIPPVLLLSLTSKTVSFSFTVSSTYILFSSKDCCILSVCVWDLECAARIEGVCVCSFGWMVQWKWQYQSVVPKAVREREREKERGDNWAQEHTLTGAALFSVCADTPQTLIKHHSRVTHAAPHTLSGVSQANWGQVCPPLFTCNYILL